MRIVKYSSVEGVIKSLGIEYTSLEMQEVGRICGFDYKLPTKEIPVEKFVELLNWAADRYYPNLPRPKGFYNLGQRFFEGYRKTILGRVQLAAIHLIGPDSVIKRVPENFSKSSNFGERTVKQLGPQNYEISFRGIPVPPDFYCGLLHAALEVTGVEKLAIAYHRIGREDVDFKITWCITEKPA